MAILLVTGRNAAEAVKRIAKSLTPPAQVRVCAVDVASFLTPGIILSSLKGIDKEAFSLILVPGTVKGDVSVVSEKTGVLCVKGPRSVYDLPLIVKKYLAGKIKLSSVEAADEMLLEDSSLKVGRELKKAYGRPAECALKIGKKKPVYLGAGIGRVVAEINDAPLLSPGELAKRAAYFYASGASIIDLGMLSGTDSSKKIEMIVDAARSAVDIPLSIDSLNSKEILAAADAGIDLVLSIDSGNCHVLDSIDVPSVVIPRDALGRVPDGSMERVMLAEKILKKAPCENLIADMVLNPINSGYSESLKAYMLFRERNPGTPMMIGAGNVTELLDADSVGANALLAGFASEQGIDLLFTVEASPKTRGSVRELSTASEMMYLAKKRGITPKDLGIDLLVLKDKKKRSADDMPAHVVPGVCARKTKEPAMEDSSFRIHAGECISAVYFKGGKPLLRITGGSAEDVYKEILARGLTKDTLHAAYLGKELSKAEIALRLGKEYVQDDDIF
ncbi:MAG: dihydropteroate synthase-like protein [Candidatus Altiarchaeia archaeon]